MLNQEIKKSIMNKIKNYSNEDLLYSIKNNIEVCINKDNCSVCFENQQIEQEIKKRKLKE